jgi:hypothetical protein
MSLLRPIPVLTCLPAFNELCVPFSFSARVPSPNPALSPYTASTVTSLVGWCSASLCPVPDRPFTDPNRRITCIMCISPIHHNLLQGNGLTPKAATWKNSLHMHKPPHPRQMPFSDHASRDLLTPPTSTLISPPPRACSPKFASFAPPPKAIPKMLNP